MVGVWLSWTGGVVTVARGDEVGSCVSLVLMALVLVLVFVS